MGNNRLRQQAIGGHSQSSIARQGIYAAPMQSSSQPDNLRRVEREFDLEVRGQSSFASQESYTAHMQSFPSPHSESGLHWEGEFRAPSAHNPTFPLAHDPALQRSREGHHHMFMPQTNRPWHPGYLVPAGSRGRQPRTTSEAQTGENAEYDIRGILEEDLRYERLT